MKTFEVWKHTSRMKEPKKVHALHLPVEDYFFYSDNSEYDDMVEDELYGQLKIDSPGLQRLAIRQYRFEKNIPVADQRRLSAFYNRYSWTPATAGYLAVLPPMTLLCDLRTRGRLGKVYTVPGGVDLYGAVFFFMGIAVERQHLISPWPVADIGRRDTAAECLTREDLVKLDQLLEEGKA